MTGLELEISFFLEVPLSSGETKGILGSFRKTSFHRLFLIALGKGSYKT